MHAIVGRPDRGAPGLGRFDCVRIMICRCNVRVYLFVNLFSVLYPIYFFSHDKAFPLLSLPTIDPSCCALLLFRASSARHSPSGLQPNPPRDCFLKTPLRLSEHLEHVLTALETRRRRTPRPCAKASKSAIFRCASVRVIGRAIAGAASPSNSARSWLERTYCGCCGCCGPLNAPTPDASSAWATPSNI